jgi:hypothetical protein
MNHAAPYWRHLERCSCSRSHLDDCVTPLLQSSRITSKWPHRGGPRGVPNNLMPVVQQVAVGRGTELTVFGNDYNTRDGTAVSLLPNPPRNFFEAGHFEGPVFYSGICFLVCLLNSFCLLVLILVWRMISKGRETHWICVCWGYFFPGAWLYSWHGFGSWSYSSSS